MKVKESLNVTFDETHSPPKTSPFEDDDLVEEEAIKVNKTRPLEDPKTSHLEAVKSILRYIKGTTHLGLWYSKGSDIETIVYADSDHAGDYMDRKSTSGICTFMGCCLTSWFLKKQTALAISSTKAKYVSVRKACQQALWMKQALIDYDISLDDILIMCDNKGAIDLSKNLIQHSRLKHIEIRHHFLHDNVQKGNISIEKLVFCSDAVGTCMRSMSLVKTTACEFRRREGGEHASASTPSEPATRSIGTEDQPIVQTSQHPEWFSQPRKLPTPDRDWNKTLSAVQRSAQSWISELVKQADARSSFNE
nr:copia protein [Tanacetum cinerariifolium]